jgi:hypothetical protein
VHNHDLSPVREVGLTLSVIEKIDRCLRTYILPADDVEANGFAHALLRVEEELKETTKWMKLIRARTFQSNPVPRVLLPYRHSDDPRKHHADCEQRNGNPKWRAAAFSNSVNDGNDKRNQRANKCN